MDEAEKMTNEVRLIKRRMMRRGVWLAALRYGRDPSSESRKHLLWCVREYDSTARKR
jgi:hypothetical protein